MYDTELLNDILEDMIEAACRVKRRYGRFGTHDDFLQDEEAQIVLDSICMQLIAIKEAVKQIDKLTDKILLQQYPQIPWREIAGIRDVLSHHYFDVNAEKGLSDWMRFDASKLLASAGRSAWINRPLSLSVP